MSSCVCKILFKSEQICGCCCKMLRGSLFWDTVYKCLCRSNVMHNPHKLNIDSNRNTDNIEIIKIAVESAKLCGKICAMRCTLVKYAKKCDNMRNNVAITYSRKTRAVAARGGNCLRIIWPVKNGIPYAWINVQWISFRKSVSVETEKWQNYKNTPSCHS